MEFLARHYEEILLDYRFIITLLLKGIWRAKRRTMLGHT